MPFFTIFFELLLLIIGVVFCVKALLSIKLLVLELPEGALKKRWNILRNLMFFFILSYGLVGIAFWLLSEELNAFLALGVSFILALGGLFAYFVGQLALQTINDVRDLALLQHESITDGLTGLRNRRYFDQRIHEEVMLSLRYKMPLTLILLDVDHFKKINDTYGHNTGDLVLIETARILQKNVRANEAAFRLGGDEFLMILPDIKDRQELRQAKERLAKSFASEFSLADLSEKLTLSIGTSLYPEDGQDIDALLQIADEEMYADKKEQKSRLALS